MSRTVMPYAINGLVEISGVRFWRIEDLSSNLTGLEFVRKPAALVRIDGDAKASHARALAVCEALNSHHAQALLKLAMVEGAE